MKRNLESRKLRKIVKGCVRQKPEAQRELYNLFAPPMMALCQRYSKNREDAEDVFQEGFIKVFQKIHQLKNTNTLKWWMKKIFINEALQKFKQLKKDPDTLGYDSTKIPGEKAEEALQSMELEAVIQTIQELPAGMQTIVNMYIIEGYSHKEIAQMVGISEGTSKSQLHDARKILQQKLVNNYKNLQV